MEWKPKRWLAALLSIFNAPLGLMYVQRPGLALAYFLALVGLQAAAIGSLLMGVGAKLSATAIIVAVGGANIAAAIHAFKIAAVSPPSRRWYSRWYGLVAIFLTYSCVVILFRSFLYEPFRFPSQSMYPTLPEGSFVFVQKFGYGSYGSLGVMVRRTNPTATVSRGELLLFRLPQDPDTIYLKRVIGLPGDHVECRGPQLIINGTPVPTTLTTADSEYQYATETFDGVSVTVAHLFKFPARDCDAVVPPDHYFMLGDNRSNSKDSRHIGMVPRTNLVGRAAVIIPAKVTK